MQVHNTRQPIYEGYRHRAFIPLTKGYRVEVDWWLAAYLAQWNWYAHVCSNGVYAVRTDNKVSVQVLMHRQLLGLEHGSELTGDHINRNTADNRLTNLRIASMSLQNTNQRVRSTNRTGIKGVCYGAERGKYQAHIQVNKRAVNLGRFATLIEAAAARKEAELKYFGVLCR